MKKILKLALALLSILFVFFSIASYVLAQDTHSISSQINSSSDDAEQKGSSVDLSSSDLELVVDGTTVQTIGMRFNNISIPKGATISNAYLEFTVDEANTEATSLTFYGEAIDNASTFSSSFNVSSRSKTSAKTNWDNISAWSTVGAKIQSPDISNVVQEIVNRSGWVQNNSLAIVVTGTGHRTAEAYDGSVTSAPKLVINYSTDGSVTQPPSTPTPTPCPLPTNTIGDVMKYINITSQNDYKIWTRIMVADSTNNSYYLAVDGECAAIVGDSSSIVPNQWVWVDYKDGLETNKIVTNLSSGLHTFKLLGREEGVKVDKIIVTKDPSCIPTGIGDNCTAVPTLTLTPVPTVSPTSVPATPTPTPTNTGSIVNIIPLADVTVKAGSPDRNYGSASSLSVDNSPIEITYMKFDLTSLLGKQIIAAKLRIRVSSSSKDTQNVKLVDDNTWVENTITYNTKPAFSTYITKINGGTSGTYLDTDLTDIVIAKLGGLLSFGIDANGNDGFDFYSKEKSTSSYRPTLILNFQ